ERRKALAKEAAVQPREGVDVGVLDRLGQRREGGGRARRSHLRQQGAEGRVVVGRGTDVGGGGGGGQGGRHAGRRRGAGRGGGGGGCAGGRGGCTADASAAPAGGTAR